MYQSYIARFYGRSLYSVCKAEIKSDVVALCSALKDGDFFSSDRFSIKLKISVITKFNLCKNLHNFCCAVISNKRGNMLQSALKAYLEVTKEENGEIDAFVTSCIPLKVEDCKSVMDIVASKYKNTTKVNIHNSVDEAIIGGLVIRVNSEIIDASIATKLKRLQEASINALSLSLSNL